MNTSTIRNINRHLPAKITENTDLLNEPYFNSISGRLHIAHPHCPHCKKAISIYEKILQCCGVTAETLLIVEPPEATPLMGVESQELERRSILDRHAIEPTLIAQRIPRFPSRKGWIGYLPKAGDITLDVFLSFVKHQTLLPVCPRCRNPLEFHKDRSETEKPFCIEETCQVFFCPCHYSQGSTDAWKHSYEQTRPLAQDEFLFKVKKEDSPHVEAEELRSIGLVSYLQELVMFAATSVNSVTEETSASPTVNINQTPVDKRQPPANVSPKPETSPQLNDSCSQFITEVICEDDAAFITRDALYTAYQRWCENTQNLCLTRKDLFQRLRSMKNISEPRRRINKADPVRVFLGIRLL